ncbi:hypothetical protein M0802_004036 [Mischocyttarus mexicanus]|nr:hypothetical protein M0802_004036 [Mischocyttarus mexicanus]
MRMRRMKRRFYGDKNLSFNEHLTSSRASEAASAVAVAVAVTAIAIAIAVAACRVLARRLLNEPKLLHSCEYTSTV